jgi:hypothetical protein
MNRNDLINRLVARKMSANGPAATASCGIAQCHRCYPGPAKAFCGGGCIPSPAKKICFAPARPAAANPKG